MSSADSTESMELTPDAAEEPSRAPEAGADSPVPEGEATGRSSVYLARFIRRVRGTPIELPILFLLAAITRFVGLYNPKAIVFDEIYFREYGLHYHVGTYYFDLHPPLGKLLIGLWAWLSGSQVDPMSKDPDVALRILPAFAGTMLIVVFYLFLRQLSGSRRVATLGAGLLLLDNAVLVESRFTLIDSMLLLWGFSAVTMALAARKATGRKHWALWTGAAIFGGMALATKATGLSMLGLVGLIWLVDAVRDRKLWKTQWKPIVGRAAVLGVSAFLVYFVVFAIHFAYLTKAGDGDAYMNQQFQSTLKGNSNYKPEASMSVFKKFTELNHEMHFYELQLNGDVHPYSTKWTSWPYMERGVFLYVANASDQKTRYIYTLGNPFVWYGAVLGVILVGVGWLTNRKKFRRYRWAMGFLAVGWAVNYLPFVLITRPMFLYHYFYALMFSIGFVVLGLGILTGWIKDSTRPLELTPATAEELAADQPAQRTWTFDSRWSQVAYWGILGAALAFFLYFAPISYGIPLTSDGLNSRMWLHSWR